MMKVSLGADGRQKGHYHESPGDKVGGTLKEMFVADLKVENEFHGARKLSK